MGTTSSNPKTTATSSKETSHASKKKTAKRTSSTSGAPRRSLETADDQQQPKPKTPTPQYLVEEDQDSSLQYSSPLRVLKDQLHEHNIHSPFFETPGRDSEWIRDWDDQRGCPYWYHPTTHQTTLSHPANGRAGTKRPRSNDDSRPVLLMLPPGWKQAYDVTLGRPFFFYDESTMSTIDMDHPPCPLSCWTLPLLIIEWKTYDEATTNDGMQTTTPPISRGTVRVAPNEALNDLPIRLLHEWENDMIPIPAMLRQQIMRKDASSTNDDNMIDGAPLATKRRIRYHWTYSSCSRAANNHPSQPQSIPIRLTQLQANDPSLLQSLLSGKERNNDPSQQRLVVQLQVEQEQQLLEEYEAEGRTNDGPEQQQQPPRLLQPAAARDHHDPIPAMAAGHVSPGVLDPQQPIGGDWERVSPPPVTTTTTVATAGQPSLLSTPPTTTAPAPPPPSQQSHRRPPPPPRPSTTRTSQRRRPPPPPR